MVANCLDLHLAWRTDHDDGLQDAAKDDVAYQCQEKDPFTEVTLKSIDPLTDSMGHVVGSLGIVQDPTRAVAWSGIIEDRRYEYPGSWE